MPEPKKLGELKDIIAHSNNIRSLMEHHFDEKSYNFFYQIKKLINDVTSSKNNLDVLIKISKLISEWEKEKPDVILESFRNGINEDAVYDIIQEELDRGPLVVEQIKASGGGGNFNIEICEVGPLYLIKANEFDDILWFTSMEDAMSHAQDVYSEFIDEIIESEYMCESDEIYTFVEEFKEHFHDVNDVAHHIDSIIIKLLTNPKFMKSFNARIWDSETRKFIDPIKKESTGTYIKKLTEKEIIIHNKNLKNKCKDVNEFHQKSIEDLTKFIALHEEDESLRDIINNIISEMNPKNSQYYD